MFKDVLHSMDVRWMSNVGLLIFLFVFVVICIWALTRKKSDVAHWNNLPLEDGEPISKPCPATRNGRAINAERGN